MPSLKALQQQQQQQFSASENAVWTRSSRTDDVSLPQLHKFWSGLSVVARRELLRIDKQALFEQVRKNLYCSRCHGLLVEGFGQIILYGKSLQANGGRQQQIVETNRSSHTTTSTATNVTASSLQQADDSRDPSVHPWGGLAATRDSMLTLLDCFLEGMPLEVLQNVFESARARERERELLYPDACGGGGRGWICQNGSFNGRGHVLKETCALHIARLSCEALVDFWSALGDETRRSLLRMKEEDFIERLMFRFNSKRFCRDCRRNVLREFKEMKELKRSRKEPQCTRWFCAADTVFRYEVSESAVQVDWQDCFAGDGGSAFQRFEWALGTGEGKCDILVFEDVGLVESAYVDNLDLSSTSACFIIVRGWKRDGRYTELSAKAHALKGQLCVHRRLIVGDGYVSITKGESIQRFFERAEETEEEEDEDAIDKDENDYESEGTRPQKHAKSPELARDFLLDAATVIFKEQVEKAFREGTARQNAHSIFVCLALSLLEERVRVACKEITSLEMQNKLLEEEEYEKREEEERRERRKQKEKEKKLRRKEKLKSKEKGARNRNNFTQVTTLDSDGCLTASPVDEDHEEEMGSNSGSQVEGTESNNSEDSMSARPSSPDMVEARPSADGFDSENGGSSQHETFAPAQVIDDALGLRDGNGAFIVERSKSAKRRTQGSRKQQQGSSNSFRKEVANEYTTSRRQCTEPQEKPHEILQSCACGSSHRSSSSKGSSGYRGPGRTPNKSSGRGVAKPAHQKTSEATRSATRLPAMERALKPSHSKSSSLDSTSSTRSSLNGLEKAMWTRRATSNGSITAVKVAVTPLPQVKSWIQPAASSKPSLPKVEATPVVSETSEGGESASAPVTEEAAETTSRTPPVVVATTLPTVDLPLPPSYHFLRPPSFGMLPPIRPQQQPFGFYPWGVLSLPQLPPPMVALVPGHLPAIPDGLTPLHLTPHHHHHHEPPQRERRGSSQTDFSFFHSKWPLSEGGGEPESHAPLSCIGEKATEYSLFAFTPSCNKGFGFF